MPIVTRLSPVYGVFYRWSPSPFPLPHSCSLSKSSSCALIVDYGCCFGYIFQKWVNNAQNDVPLWGYYGGIRIDRGAHKFVLRSFQPLSFPNFFLLLTAFGIRIFQDKNPNPSSKPLSGLEVSPPPPIHSFPSIHREN